MAQVLVLSGIPGSGKSHYAEKLKKDFLDSQGGNGKAVIISADDFFVNDDGIFVFDPLKISDANAWCMGEFIYHIARDYAEPPDLIIVANTSTTAMEISPYMLVGAAFTFETKVVRFVAKSEEEFQLCMGRQTHGVPESTMRAMQAAMEVPLPGWWAVETLPIGGLGE